MKLQMQTKALVMCVALWAATAAAQVSGGVVFKRDVAVPVIASDIWSEPAFKVFGGTPHVGALVGYGEQETLDVGYYAGLRWDVTPRTAVGVGVAYLAPVGEVRWGDLVDKAGVTFLFRVKL